ncbi:MAG TPA: Tol-Pal system subunit TolQ [Deltaproteobacteria bacterium]|nr:Tol-Pal system subunit TolQ [Deltaproteobacteria bacterium]
MVWNAGPMVKFVMALLVGFSVVSWAIIVYKIKLLRRVEGETAVFYDLFWRNMDKKEFHKVLEAAREHPDTPLSGLFTAVSNEGRIGRDDLDRIKRILSKKIAEESMRLEAYTPFLATTGNTAPFIGLFGTVWGIMNSFRGISVKGAASLAVVAPGISEALVATALGLMAAIPAVVGYNHILSRIDRARADMQGFASDLLNAIEKELSRPAPREPKVERHGV